jgi:hypothetical protein
MEPKEIARANGIIFRRRGRLGIALSAIFDTVFALLFLGLAISQWNVSSQVDIASWWNQWWVYAIFCIAAGFLAWEKWNEFFFVRLRVATEGIWFYRLGSTTFISWDQIEQVGVLNPDNRKSPVIGLILRKSEVDTPSNPKQIRPSLKFALSPFADDWFVSELRAEIKRQRPSLPMQ